MTADELKSKLLNIVENAGEKLEPDELQALSNALKSGNFEELQTVIQMISPDDDDLEQEEQTKPVEIPLLNVERTERKIQLTPKSENSENSELTGRLTEGVLAFLDDGDWKYSIEKANNRNIITFGFAGKNGTLSVRTIVREKTEVVSVYSKLEVSVPEEKRLQISEFLSRANYGLMIGNFELDFRDGEVRFKISADYEGAIVTNKTFKNLILSGLSVANRYYPGIMKVIWGGVSVKDAINEVES